MAKIAMPLAADFEDSEFSVPYEKLQAMGHEITVFGSKAGQKVKGKQGKISHTVETQAADIKPETFDALVIPGGYSPDHLRIDNAVVSFVRDFVKTGKPVAAVCHGPQLLIEADVVKDRTLTSWPSVRRDLENAGANWVDQEVAEDGNFITSRNPDDLPAFVDAIANRLDMSKTA